MVFLLVTILADEPESGLNAGNWGYDGAGSFPYAWGRYMLSFF
jgi:hypothetical protein